MSKPDIHARNSVRRYGGNESDYIEIHNMMDSSKAHIGDSRHRSLLHSTFGCFLMERMFGINFKRLDEVAKKHNLSPEAIADILDWKRDCVNTGTQLKNSEGRKFSVRNIAEEHNLEDFGGKFIPTVQDYLENLPIADWMVNGKGLPPSFRNAQTQKGNVD